MEAPLDVPVGNLIDFDTETPSGDRSEPAAPAAPGDGGHPGDAGEVAAEESDATESADSENDMGDSPRHWRGGYRRSSSNESFSSSHSTESAQDEATAERREFMRSYVEKIFTGGEDLDQEEKARFGELCSSENGKGREWFARYVSAQRCNSKCVSEQTFYRLMQSFALVLFECHQMDDFSPAKNLMTMCFTYYYIGKPHALPLEAKEEKPTGSIDSYLKSANTWLAEKKDIAERLLKNTSAKTENVKGFFGGLETKLKGPATKKSDEGEDKPKEKLRKTVSLQSPEEEKKGEKIYLYMHLKQQPIWHNLRFWNAAFFDAVHCERRKRSPTTREKWCHMTQEERDDSLRFNENITFGQLGTFIHNMLAFGLNKKLCSDFLKKQATIGNLDEGRGEPGDSPFSGDSGGTERGWDGSPAPLSPFLSPPQSNTSCSVTTSSRWPRSSRPAGTRWPRDGGRTGGEGRGTHLRGYLGLNLGYLPTKPHTRAAIKPA
uniref:KIAA0513 n=1 Tax=Cyanoderma ruficeps TaxID=181631 RepID=A0A8C3NU06_9PASS